MAEQIIQNRVASSGLITVDLASYFPAGNEVAIWDMKPYLFMGLIVKEADFRAALQQIDWKEFQNKHVAIICSADAIIPHWAWMLAATYLQPIADSIYFGDADAMKTTLLLQKIEAMDTADFTDKRVVIKGCGSIPVPASAYMAVTAKLLPVAKSIMYGEPCSTVPVFKRK